MSKRLALLPSFSLSHKHESTSSPYPSNAQTGMNAIGRLSAESGIDTNVSVDTDDVSSEKDRLHYSQDFQLPQAVRSRVDADVMQANAFAITTALFAGVLISLVSTLTEPDTNTPAWRAVRFFTYSSIVINLSGTTLALVLIKLCTELPCRAQRMILSNPSSLPARLAQDGVPRDLLLNQYALLEGFGMPKGYRFLDTGAAFWVLSGNILTFVSIMMWVWLAGDTVIASVTTILMALPIFGISYAVALTRG